MLLSGQLQIGFASAVDGQVDKIVDNLGLIKPTFMAGAPRIFEKVYAQVVSTTAGGGRPKAKIFDWAFGVGKDVAARRAAGSGVPLLLGLQHKVADALVFSQDQRADGGPDRLLRVRLGGASREVGEWFNATGIDPRGLRPDRDQSAGLVRRTARPLPVGTVGTPLPGTEVEIADDGELLLRGPGVMRGYHNLPEQTAEVMLADGWLRTGDIGEIDDHGSGADHRPQEGPDQDLRRQVHRAEPDRGRGSRRCARC